MELDPAHRKSLATARLQWLKGVEFIRAWLRSINLASFNCLKITFYTQYIQTGYQGVKTG